MLGQGDLVEHGAFGTRERTLVIGAATLFEPFERLPLPRGLAQRVDPRADLGVVAVEVELSSLLRLLHSLQVGLGGEQIGGAGGAARGRGTLRGERADDLVAHRAQPLGAARLPVQRPGKLLLGEILAALAQRPQAFQGKAERRHGPVVGRAAGNWRG